MLLGSGSIILPGNWGRIIRRVGPAHNRWQREQLLEEVRMGQANAVQLPSRLDSTFACTSEEGIRFYDQVQNRGGNIPSVLYEVEKINPDAAEHRTDYNLAILTPGGMSEREAAERYWLGDFWF